ncbi:hypothetical protein JCM30237_20270 [Halolamina litorea]|uniref:Uncharacterized protein n=1 Tax=Halolamina litorea TaxID=1515593 RepID=A0ABD6BT74_9EURY|nr:hypothetical protein [Halolamina litorea]
MTDDPAVYDHYRLTDGDGSGPTFRVVGFDDADEQVTLLRVTDAGGNRRATGELRHVGRERLAREFEAVGDPGPRFETPDYLGGLAVLAGAAVAVHPAGDPLAGALLVVAGGYVLWRRH